MNEIAQCIINNTLLSVEQADEVCRDLDQLVEIGAMHVSKWTCDLVRHYYPNVMESHPLIQIAGWEAAAKAYRGRTIHAEPNKKEKSPQQPTLKPVPMMEKQLDKALKLLCQAWVTVDYFDHNGTLSTQVQDFLHETSREQKGKTMFMMPTRYIIQDHDNFISGIPDDKCGCWTTPNPNEALRFSTMSQARQAAKELPTYKPNKINIVAVNYEIVATV